MQTVVVTDPEDRALAALWNLRDAEVLHARHQFIAEGRLVVGRVLEDPRYVVRALLVNPAARRALEPQLTRSTFRGTVYECDTAGFAAITGFNIHRGCLALVDRPPDQAWQQQVAADGPVVVLEGVTDPDNVGAAFRNAAAFGAAAVLLSPTCCDPLYRKALRTSMGAALRVPYARLDPWPGSLADVKHAGRTIAALSPREPSTPLASFTREYGGRPIALLVGTEGAGLTDDAEALADLRVSIPMAAGVDSLNLAVATGIALHATFAARPAHGAWP